MSALTPHIRVLRAEAHALERLAAVELNKTGWAVMVVLAKAKRAAIDILEAEEAALKPPREGTDKLIHYNPRGKR